MIELVKQDYLIAPGAGKPWGIGFAGSAGHAVQTWGYQHSAPRYYHARHANLRFGVGGLLVAQVGLHFDPRRGDFKAVVEVDSPEVWITVATKIRCEEDIARIAWAQEPLAHAWASLEVRYARGWEIVFDTRLARDLVATMRSREQQNILRVMSGLAPLPEPFTATAGEARGES